MMSDFWSNPKSTIPERIPKLLKLANGQACMCCGNRDGTVVAAHRNEGKGIAKKNPDWQISFLCSTCHFRLDNGNELTKEERRNLWNAAYVKTIDYLFRNGIVGMLK
jgi:hypothetical protein